MQKKTVKDQQKILWLCTCIGLILGIVVVILDYTLTQKPTLNHPFSMVGFAMAISGLGWAIGKAANYMSIANAGQSLKPPEELANQSTENETIIPEKKTKYSKAQARQRYKQGKA